MSVRFIRRRNLLTLSHFRTITPYYMPAIFYYTSLSPMQAITLLLQLNRLPISHLPLGSSVDIFGFSIDILLLLLVVSLVAGFLDTLAGGGGLITVPALMMTGIPPIFALGTNKLQGATGTAVASLMMLRKHKVKLSDVKGLMLAAFIGSALGTIAVQFITTDALSILIPVVLIFIAAYFLLSKKIIETTNVQKISHGNYRNFVIPAIGAYDGLLGPGTGSFFSLAGVALRGLGIIDSTAAAKTLNFSTNIASLIVFIVSGKIIWILGAVMMLGQFTGAWMGSHFLFKINPNYLKYLVVFISVGMLIKYFVSYL